jgi:hypothetical protein
MSFSRPFQWYHSHADPIWPDGTFNPILRRLVKDIETGEDLAVKLEPQLAKAEFNTIVAGFSVTFELLFLCDLLGTQLISEQFSTGCILLQSLVLND